MWLGFRPEAGRITGCVETTTTPGKLMRFLVTTYPARTANGGARSAPSLTGIIKVKFC